MISICCHAYVTDSRHHLSQNPRSAKKSRVDQIKTRDKPTRTQHYTSIMLDTANLLGMFHIHDVYIKYTSDITLTDLNYK
jgi:hypothetical protein